MNLERWFELQFRWTHEELGELCGDDQEVDGDGVIASLCKMSNGPRKLLRAFWRSRSG